MTKQQSCAPWLFGAFNRIVATYANVFAAGGGVLTAITATLEA
jgi:hypothetical protein